MKKKIKVMIAGAAAAGTIAVAGISYAAFARNNNVDAVGTSESFRPVTVSGQWAGGPAGGTSGLLPGEAGDVRITVSVSGDNTVAAKVSSIVAKPITAGNISGIADANKKGYCASMLVPATYSPSLILAKGAANVQITLEDAVTLKPEAEIDCEGMTFTTGWTVSFAPDRTTTGLVGSGAQVSVAPAP
jgi:hypothetical protein